MASANTLVYGQQYRAIYEFIDYDGGRHAGGETWVFEATNFVPYEDGLTLHVSTHGMPQVYRFHWRPEKQAFSMEHFTDFVAAC